MFDVSSEAAWERVCGVQEAAANSGKQSLKNFIRHGKNHGSSSTLVGNGFIKEEKEARDNFSYDELADELVASDNERVQYQGISKYQFQEKIGEGAFSEVYKAVNLISNQAVAVKVIKKFQLDANQKQSVLKEVTIMRQLKHDNIVEFIEFIEVDEHYYIVQELLNGGEIFNEIVKFTYFSEDLSRHVLKQLCDAIKYLHDEVGVVHRDIKPENLLFQPIPIIPSTHRKLRRTDDPNKVDEGVFKNGYGGGGIGVLKLADFGLSKQIWQDDTKTPCGTVGYTAPEVVRDEHYSKEVDMWGIGCVLYTMLCGFPPFYDEKIDVLTQKVAKGEYQFLQPWWDEISAGAKNCVRQLLQVDPRKRYTIDELLRDPWLNYVPIKKPVFYHYPEFQRSATDMYSPQARVMKDAFDIGNAVHRIGEEKLHKRNRAPEILEEEEEGDVEDSRGGVVGKVEVKMGHDLNGAFELNLAGSTIISRRKKISS